jgi:putative GTP pyrophosphokinase
MSEGKQSGEDRWLDEIVPIHSRLTEAVAQLIQTLVKNNKAEYLSIDKRTKRIDSIKEKIKRKNYKTLKNEMTDISGIRIIVYLESHVDPIVNIIRETFEIDQENSLDRKTDPRFG